MKIVLLIMVCMSFFLGDTLSIDFDRINKNIQSNNKSVEKRFEGSLEKADNIIENFSEIDKRKLATARSTEIVNSNYSSNSSSSSTSTTSSTSSSTSNTKGMKSIRSQGKYGEYPSWSIECNSGYSRTLYLDKNNHWHANGSSSDMGSKYDSWSKEQVADYICNEL